MRLTTEGLVAWLQQEIDEHPTVQFPIFFGRQPDMPDRCLTIYKSSAGRDVMDGTFEQLNFHFVTRGRSESLADAENLAYAIDEIMDNTKNEMMGDIYVTDVWIQNHPFQLPMIDKQSRFQFAADYVAVASKYN